MTPHNAIPDSLMLAAMKVLRESEQERTDQLNEALTSSAQKAMATKAANSSKDSSGKTAAERISGHIMGSDRISIPMERLIKPDVHVVKHLESSGYAIHDYEQGLAKKHGDDRTHRIGRVLNQTGASDDIRKRFEKDPARQGLKSTAHIVISRRPSDVAACSTGQAWQSCQTLAGSYSHNGSKVSQEKGSHTEYVPTNIASGAHVAYLVHKPEDVDVHNAPIARTMLNVFNSRTSDSKILRPSEVYGDEWSGFHHSVNKWAEENFPEKDAHYDRHRGAYPEGKASIRSYAPEHDEHWLKNHTDAEMLQNHPNKEMLDKLTNVNMQHSTGSTKYLMNNKNLSDESQSKIIHGAMQTGRGQDFIADTAKHIRSPHVIQKILDNYSGNYRLATKLALNDNTTSDQLHHIIDTYGAGKTNIPNERKLAHNGYSATILANVARHPNATDSHFKSILELDEFGSKLHSIEAYANHADTLEHIASRYHDESIGKKLIDIGNGTPGQPQMHGGRIISSIAEKHPHLLKTVDDNNISLAIPRYGHNEGFRNVILQRNNPYHLKRLMNHSVSPEFLTKMTQHENPEVAEHAKQRLDLFTR